METTHDAHLFTHRRAHRRAAWRTRLADEMFRYVLVSLLLLVLVRPIGVIVALVWGFRIARRFYRGGVGPRLHRRFVREELRRCGHGHCADSIGRRGRVREERHRPARPEALAESMGDDPHSGRALDFAQTALAELDDTERATRPAVTGQVCVADLVEDVVDAFEAQASAEGITFRLETDAEGLIEGDAVRLKAVLLDLVNESVRAVQRGAEGPGRVKVQMGENLAGSEVWVRIRDDRMDAADGARGTYGSRPITGVAGATLETQASPRNGMERILTLKKNTPAPRRDDGASDRA